MILRPMVTFIGEAMGPGKIVDVDHFGISENSTEISGYPLRFGREHPRHLVKLVVTIGAVGVFGNRVRKPQATPFEGRIIFCWDQEFARPHLFRH